MPTAAKVKKITDSDLNFVGIVWDFVTEQAYKFRRQDQALSLSVAVSIDVSNCIIPMHHFQYLRICGRLCNVHVLYCIELVKSPEVTLSG